LNEVDSAYRIPLVAWKVRDVVLASAVVVLVFVAAVVVLAVTALPLSELAQEESPAEAAAREAEQLQAAFPIVTALAEGAMLAIVVLIVARKYNYRRWWTALGIRAVDTGWLRPRLSPYAASVVSYTLLPAGAILVGLMVSVLYVTAVQSLGIDFLVPQEPPPELFGTGLRRIINGLLVAVWAPITEEVFFRGFILAALIRPLGALRAALVTSLVFAAAHVDPGTVVPIFVLGMLMAWLYLRTKSLVPAILAHMLQNTIAFSATFLV
jgi:membrane protease YdiL (CAAX protease family)